MAALDEEKRSMEEVEAVEKTPDNSSKADVLSEEPRPHVSFKTKMAILVCSSHLSSTVCSLTRLNSPSL